MLENLKATHRQALSTAGRLEEFQESDVSIINNVAEDTIHKKVREVNHLMDSYVSPKS